MLIVGLTGGIGSGKSTVARRLEERGAGVIDADVLAREQVAPGMPALAEIVREFGPGVMSSDGSLDRRALRRQVFADEAARKRLEALLHPRIRKAMQAAVRRLETPYVVLVIPLLLETGQTDLVQRILVVDLPEEQQVARVMTRDGQQEEQVRAILAAQWPRARRLAAADDVIDNSGSLEGLLALTDAMHERYMSLSRDPPA
jgi:dephospho-CoA kinase